MSTVFSQANTGCKHLCGSLYSVPFESLRVSDVDQKDSGTYQFKNPRLLTNKGQAELLDKRLSFDLRDSIKSNSLLNPLVCRWVKDGDKYYPMVVGGERRYRALDYLIRKKEMVVDPSNLNNQCSAEVAYANIPCQVFAVDSDLDALALAWAENKSRINLTDGHEVAELINLRKFNANDEKILSILQWDEKKLAETDNLIANLDAETLSDLLENRIDRASALELASIENLDERNQVRVNANEISKEKFDKKIQKLKKQVSAALDKKEIAQGKVVDAEFHEDTVALQEAKEEVVEAEKKVKRKLKEKNTTAPLTTIREINQVVANSGLKDKVSKILSAKKINEGIDFIDSVINNNGRAPDASCFFPNVEALQMIRDVLNENVLSNNSDFSSVLMKFSKEDPVFVN